MGRRGPPTIHGADKGAHTMARHVGRGGGDAGHNDHCPDDDVCHGEGGQFSVFRIEFTASMGEYWHNALDMFGDLRVFGEISLSCIGVCDECLLLLQTGVAGQ